LQIFFPQITHTLKDFRPQRDSAADLGCLWRGRITS